MKNKENLYSNLWQPIIVIGAGRSGTTMLHETLSTHKQIDALPPDINFVWTAKNLDQPDDQLDPALARPEVIRFIHRYFQNYSSGMPFIAEKSVCNSIRIPFVLKIFPNAKIIYVQRDGRDVIESVFRNWVKVRGRGYLWKKVKAFPLLEAFPYAWHYAKNLVRMKLGWMPSDDYIWGVKYPGYREDLKNLDTLSIVAKQWQYCVEKSLEDLHSVPKNQLLHIRYEDFVKNPKTGIQQVALFLGMDDATGFNIEKINARTIGGHKTLSAYQLGEISPIIAKTLQKLGYGIYEELSEKI